MALTRWNPWAELFDLQAQVDQLFQPATNGGVRPGNGHTSYRNLAIDIRQTDSEFVIDASVPGYTPDEVEVTVNDGVLTIRGEHRAESEDKGDEYIRRERHVSSVFRRIGLPSEVRSEDISATFENGVLHVMVPRTQKAQPRRVPVTAGVNGEQPSATEETPAQS